MVSIHDEDVDLPKLLLIGSGLYTCLTATLHPLNVIKTRAQASSSASIGRLELLRGMLATSGVRGLFHGVMPVLTGAVPARSAYILALEGVRPKAAAVARGTLGLQGASADAFAHGVGGLAAAGASMLIYVPVDVVSQRMMVAGDPTVTALRGGASTAEPPSFAREVRSIVDTSGVRGLFRGLGLSMLIGLPAGSVWWAAYGSARGALSRSTSLGDASDMAQKSIAGCFAAFCTVSLVAPLDTIKTMVQLEPSSTESTWQLATRLVRRDGFLSLYAGFTPRLLHLSLWGTALITIYEELKRVCRRPPRSALVRTLSGSAAGVDGPGELSGR